MTTFDMFSGQPGRQDWHCRRKNLHGLDGAPWLPGTARNLAGPEPLQSVSSAHFLPCPASLCSSRRGASGIGNKASSRCPSSAMATYQRGPARAPGRAAAFDLGAPSPGATGALPLPRPPRASSQAALPQGMGDARQVRPPQRMRRSELEVRWTISRSNQTWQGRECSGDGWEACRPGHGGGYADDDGSDGDIGTDVRYDM